MPDMLFHYVLSNNIYCNSNDFATGLRMLVLKLLVLCTLSPVCSLLLALFDVGARVSGVTLLTRPSRPHVLLQLVSNPIRYFSKDLGILISGHDF